MRDFEIKFWTLRNDPGWINCIVAVIIMLFDVFKVYSLPNSGLLVQVTCVGIEFRIVTDSTQVGFEV